MGFSRVNVWIRNPKNCNVLRVKGLAWVRVCCGEETKKVDLVDGHAEITDLPPGCYVVDAEWDGGKAKETMVIVNCGDIACVNLIAEGRSVS
ncbi:MAG: hypothetical protein QG610_169 [Euryarchaeota archaeon]|nr:hypothetical protein [Euryarchaeota archaeon]